MGIATSTITSSPVLPLVPSSEDKDLRAAIAQIAGKYGNEYYREKALAKEPLTELRQVLVDSGFYGVTIPTEYGGGGMGMSTFAVIMEELAAAGSPVGSLVTTEAIASSVLARHGTPEQKERWLTPIPKGELALAFAMTEPDAGSNAHNVTTFARKENGRYYIRGAKTFISGLEQVQKILVMTRTGTDEKSGRALLSLFMIDVDAKGLSREDIPTAPQQPERQWQLFFDDVEVTPDDLVGSEHGGLRAVFDGLNPERITGAAIGIGIGRYALGKASEYANVRNVWGVPIGSHQGLAHPLAEAKIQLEAATLLTQKAAALYDSGLSAGEASNMAKFAAAEAAIRCLDQSIQTHGGNGLAEEYGLANLWWTARLLRTAPVSREMILNFVAEHSLKLPKSY